MNSAVLFILSVIGLGSAYILYTYGGIRGAKDYFKANPGVLAGIVKFTGIAILITALFTFISPSKAHADDKGTWFAYGEAYVGLDHTKKVSPQCVAGKDDKITSNGGIRVNFYQSYDKRFEFNGKYTHHSCAFSVDRNSYDGVGFELTYKLWSR